MAFRRTVEDKNYNVIGVRKETANSFQVIFDNYEEEFWIELDRNGINDLIKAIEDVKQEQYY
ncbi:hypothetical protein [Virgibacillus siamensis]|uniref:hypothetical protein n=1 Tax=Virgibacillus siamensis TaxID=480071 RepID=UPI0009841C52|nr:hypothetical protein [Virgibacillus siamensis]